MLPETSLLLDHTQLLVSLCICSSLQDCSLACFCTKDAVSCLTGHFVFEVHFHGTLYTHDAMSSSPPIQPAYVHICIDLPASSPYSAIIFRVISRPDCSFLLLAPSLPCSTCLPACLPNSCPHCPVRPACPPSLCTRQSGAFTVTSEMALFQLMQGKDHSKFKEISKLVQEPRPDSLVGLHHL